MADSRLPALTEISAPVLLDELYVVDVSDTTDHASGTSRKITGTRLGGLLLAGVCQGRLTTESGVGVSTSDRTSQGTLYFTPYVGNKVALYDGTRWAMHTFTERSLSLTLTSGNNYDVFLYDNAGTLTLETLIWTNDTARATGLTTQDGVYVKSGDTTRLYLGTIRASGSNVTADSLEDRFVWNNYNRVHRPVRRLETTDSWTYSTAAWRSFNNSTANRVEVVCGVAGQMMQLVANTFGYHSANSYGGVGIGYDSTSAILSGSLPGRFQQVNAVNAASSGVSVACHQTEVGYHYYQHLEWGAAATNTWYGDAGAPTQLQSGLSGAWEC
jgi:hypothetical protein